MQRFGFTSAPVGASQDVVLTQHPFYVEVLRRIRGSDEWVSCYLIRVGMTKTAAVTCWGTPWDVVFKQLADPKYGQIYSDEFRKLWPTFFQLIDNAIAERYELGAITQFIDPDDATPKWFIAVLSTFDLDSLPTEAGEIASAGLIDRATDLSVSIVKELQKELSFGQKARIAMRGGMVGYREGKVVADRWEERLNWLQGLIGS